MPPRPSPKASSTACCPGAAISGAIPTTSRSGLLDFTFRDDFGFDDYVEWALDVPMYFVVRDGHYHDCTHVTFRQFMNGALKGEIADWEPTMGDWTNHLSTLFPDVRLKRFLEMRGADGGPWRRICALPAFWVGLLYDDAALDDADMLTKDWTFDEVNALRDAVPAAGLAGDVPRPCSSMRRGARSHCGFRRPASRRATSSTGKARTKRIFLAPLDEVHGQEGDARRGSAGALSRPLERLGGAGLRRISILGQAYYVLQKAVCAFLFPAIVTQIARCEPGKGISMLPLFDMMMQAQNGAAMDAVSKQFNLAQEQAAKAMAALMPAFSAGLKRSTSNPYDFMGLMQAVASGNYAKYFEDMSKAFTPQGISDGNNILAQLFGSKEVSRAVAAQAAQMTGIGQEIYKQMLPVMADTLMGGLFKQSMGQMATPVNPFVNTPMGETDPEMAREHRLCAEAEARTRAQHLRQSLSRRPCS